jgi:hypothetical protein
MANNLPSWVQQPQQSGASTPYANNSNMAGANAPMVPTAAPTPAQQVHNPNAWDGIGPNTNQDAPQQVNNSGDPIHASNVGSLNLPPQMQQFLSAFQQMGGQGFQGFQPVQGNPFAVNNGANINQWGTASGPGGIYGGT